MNRMMAERARRAVVVTDSSKLGTVAAFAAVGGVGAVPVLLTDDGADAAAIAALRAAGYEVLLDRLTCRHPSDSDGCSAGPDTPDAAEPRAAVSRHPRSRSVSVVSLTLPSARGFPSRLRLPRASFPKPFAGTFRR